MSCLRHAPWLALCSIALVGALAGAEAQAQTRIRPSEELPPPPVPSGPQYTPVEPELDWRSPEPDGQAAPRGSVASGLRIQVDSFDVQGSTAFDAETLEAVLAPFTGRALSTEELLAARDSLTALYLDAGYVTSGAIIPDQDPASGVVRLEVIEGRLAGIEVEGNTWFRDRYFVSRLERAAGTPVDAAGLERALQVLQRHPRIRRIGARLLPGDQRGESRLRLVVDEAPPITASVRAANDIAASIGAYEGGLYTQFFNPVGVGDMWSFGFTGGAGLQDYVGAVEVPITPWDTIFSFRYRYADTQIVDVDLSAVDIVSEAESISFGIRHPLIRRGGHDLWIGLIAERERSQSFLNQVCFQFETLDCEIIETVLRPSLTYSWRRPSDVIAMVGLFSIGLDALDATSSRALRQPDGQFLAFLGQASWAHVFDWGFTTPTLVSRVDMQFASQPLLSLEKISMGGLRTVRGYPENALVRDQGVIASAELRIPILTRATGQTTLELIPFFDWGKGWNVAAPIRENTISSIGIGLSARPFDWMRAEIYWGGKLNDSPFEPSDALQRNGISFQVEVGAW